MVDSVMKKKTKFVRRFKHVLASFIMRDRLERGDDLQLQRGHRFSLQPGPPRKLTSRLV